MTECKLEPVEICAPAGCGIKEGEEICYDRKYVILVFLLYFFKKSGFTFFYLSLLSFIGTSFPFTLTFVSF